MIKNPIWLLLFFLCVALLRVLSAQAGTTYIACANINGSANASAESSGTLPGSSPSTIAPVLKTTDGKVIPMWYDRVFPPLDPTMLEETKRILEDKKKLSRQLD